MFYYRNLEILRKVLFRSKGKIISSVVKISKIRINGSIVIGKFHCTERVRGTSMFDPALFNMAADTTASPASFLPRYRKYRCSQLFCMNYWRDKYIEYYKMSI